MTRVAGFSMSPTAGFLMSLDTLLALGFAGYTLAGGRLPEQALAVPGALMAAWLLLLAWDLHRAAL